jgi:hypothetical protein
MKKNILLIMCALTLTIAPTFAAPQGGGHGGGMGGGGMHAGASSMNRGGGMPSSHIGGARPSNMGARPTNMGGGRAPMAGRAPMHGGTHYAGARPMPMYVSHHHHMYRPFYPVYPYYSYYYPTYYSSYSYYPTNYVYDDVPVATEGGTTVIVKDDYAGVNATANVINAAANAAAAIKFLTW